ncbi:unnamed protein product [Rotaria sordida]|uniref:DDE Tnp4 domain-containing protein n=1 Tax=Rotaria sordida TaxID=392033 RepID=A0A815CB54_9BILA|nr:unnamed protein product [Rotaria sordida]CAF1281328.1 unnamed protein product [Rotaria sordida]
MGHTIDMLWNVHKSHHQFYNPTPFAVIAEDYVDQIVGASPLVFIPALVPINMDLLFFQFAIFFYGYGVYLHWVHVSKCYHGSVHDLTVLRESGLLEYVNDSIQIIADKAYIGEEYVVMPRKKPHGRELTDEDKDFNIDINSARAAIKNIIQRLKTYAIFGVVYRGAIGDFHKATKIVQVISALCNLNLNKHSIRK